jgi:glucokinase
MSAPLAIGIDVGATKIAAALVTATGEVVAETRLPTDPAGGVAAVVDRLASAVTNLAGQAPGPVAGVGIGTPGYVDAAAGIVRNAVNLGWVELPLVDAVREQTGGRYPVWVENDANVHALGEYIFGAARGLDSFADIAIGSGLGGGVMVHGKLVTGDSYTAAELGHLVLDPAGRPCVCGLRGCVETVVSGPGLVKTVRELFAQGAQPTRLADDAHLTTEGVVAAARQGDALALAALAETSRWLGITFAVIVAVINPAAIVVGGGLGHSAYDLLVPPAQSELQRRVPPSSYCRLRIMPSQVHSSAVGASALVWHYQNT